MHCFPSDPNIRKEWMNFIFNEFPDCVIKNLVLCLRHFTADLFTNKAQFDSGFSERLKVKDNAVLNILDPTVMLHHTSVRNCFHYVVPIALSVITDRLICTEYLCVFNLNHCSVHLWRMWAVKQKVLANHSRGRLLPSLQSTTPIQTKRSDEGGQNRTENSLLLLNDDVFYVKILITL